uniref:DNA polymerase iota n=1 Tax=Tetraselmis sp. GSL018 TaxID=582737 RepID=A0A061RGN2_9CHLO
MGHPKIFSDTEKRSLEAYRISQFGSPLHSRLAHPSLAIDEHPSPGDTGRVVLHFDVDAFYAQVEEVRDPSLRDRPLGITQKYIIVTSNYPARKHGVTKLMAISEAKRLCPDIALVSGEDLTPYRLASRRIQEVLQRFGTVERLGMDECFVDVTDEVQRRLRAGEPRAGGFRGHVFAAGTALRQDNPYRPQDVRAAADRVPGEASCGGGRSRSGARAVGLRADGGERDRGGGAGDGQARDRLPFLVRHLGQQDAVQARQRAAQAR